MHGTVSIIMPTYNREKLISRAIESIIKQTYTNWELLIVDDYSTDNTKEKVEQYVNIDKRIKYLKNGRKKGVAGARNFGILNSKGEYIAFLDSDDEWFQHHLSESISAINETGVKLSFSLWILRKNDGSISRVFDPVIPEERRKLERLISILNPEIKGKYIIFGDDFYEKSFLEGGAYCTNINTLVAKREVIEKVGLFNENLEACEDSDFIYRCILQYNFCLIDSYHHAYYQGEDNLYNFFDRSTIDFKKLLNDRTFIEKFTSLTLNQIKMNIIQKHLIRKSSKIVRKKECINKLNKIISKKYFTISFLNYQYNKDRSIVFSCKSFLYELKKQRVLSFLRWFFKFNPEIEYERIRSDLSIW
jgi:glycosyltransferase involved in cell wall biosynthesis